METQDGLVRLEDLEFREVWEVQEVQVAQVEGEDPAGALADQEDKGETEGRDGRWVALL